MKHGSKLQVFLFNCLHRFGTSLRNERKKDKVPPPGAYDLPEYTTAGPTYIVPKY